MPTLFRSPRLHQLLSSQGRLLHFEKDESVGSTDEQTEIMFVLTGYVKRYRIANNGSLGVQIVYGPRDVFSLTNVYNLLLGQSIYDGPETYYYQAMDDTQVFSIGAVQFKEAVQKDPFLYKELFSEAGQHLKACVHRIENMALLNAYSRVAHELLFSTKKFGARTSTGIKLQPPFTHQDIADILSLTRETVSKSFAQLRKEGIIDQNRRPTILDIVRLEQAAYQ